MSRSYKKFPIIKDHSKGMKTIANRRVRKQPLEALSNGMFYKKMFQQYNICDFKIKETFNEYLQAIKKREDIAEFTDEEIIKYRNEWEKMYKRK